MDEFTNVCHCHGKQLVVGVVVVHGERPALVSRLRLVNLASAFTTLAFPPVLAKQDGTLPCIHPFAQASIQHCIVL